MCVISKNLSISKFDRFFVFVLFIVDEKVLGQQLFLLLVVQVSFLSSYLDRSSFNIRANSAALSSFP